jgi:hypothetical protein
MGGVMSDVIGIAADALVPILAAGGGAVATGAAGEAGSELYKAAASVIAKIGRRLHGRKTTKAEVAEALQSAIDDGDLTVDEVKRLCLAYRGSGSGSGNTATNLVGEAHAEILLIGTNTIETLNLSKRDG